MRSQRESSSSSAAAAAPDHNRRNSGSSSGSCDSLSNSLPNNNNTTSGKVSKLYFSLKILQGILLNPVVAMTILGMLGNIVFDHQLPDLLNGILKVLEHAPCIMNAIATNYV